MSSTSDPAKYYAERTSEYEKVYLKPERQEDLARLKARLRELLAGHTVLEVACGTGYWTAVIAETAALVLATDINPEVLALAEQKKMPRHQVRFLQEDAFSLKNIEGRFTAGLAAFWWSHIRKSQLKDFLSAFHAKLAPGARVVFVDNSYVPGSSSPITRTDHEGNTYQQRRLEGGATYEVLKNFPDEREIRDVLGTEACRLSYERLTYYWLGWYAIHL
jgi:demethylmenaquinone methyltransferase/2-methoxy-6-polyprenyl-1,4-benzoquinol methylase